MRTTYRSAPRFAVLSAFALVAMSCVGVPTTLTVLRLRGDGERLSGVDEFEVEVLDRTSSGTRSLARELVVLRANERPRDQCIALEAMGIGVGYVGNFRVRVRGLRRLGDGRRELRFTTTVPVQVREGVREEFSVRVPSECANETSSACLPATSSPSDCAGFACRGAPESAPRRFITPDVTCYAVDGSDAVTCGTDEVPASALSRREIAGQPNAGGCFD